MSHPNDPVRFAHIAPTKYLSRFTATNGVHLILSHLVETDKQYADFYRGIDDTRTLKIMDNGGFEMYKQGLPMYPASKLIDMAHECGADVIVLPDYPGEHASKTIRAAEEMIPKFYDAGFGSFFVPQSEVGQIDQLLDAFEWGINNPHVNLIGVSILACPLAFNVESGNKLQRFLARWRVFNLLDRRGLLGQQVLGPDTRKLFHCLGMVDGPREIELLRPFHQHIYSWDSSAAVWAGLNGMTFDDSPTGLIDGKFELEVDFGFDKELDEATERQVQFNINVIDQMVAAV